MQHYTCLFLSYYHYLKTISLIDVYDLILYYFMFPVTKEMYVSGAFFFVCDV